MKAETAYVNSNFLSPFIARLAQLAERKALNLVVVGSTPTSGENNFGNFWETKFDFFKNQQN